MTGPTCYLKPLQVAQPRGLIHRTTLALDALASVWPANGIVPSATPEVTADLMGGASRAFVALAAGQMTADEYRYAEKALLAVERIETLALQSSYFGVEHMDPVTLRVAYSDGLERTALDRHLAAFISMKGVLPYSATDVEPLVLPTPTAQLAHYTSMITTLGQSLLHNPALELVTGGYRVNPSLVDTLEFADRAGQIGRAFATLAQGYRHVDGVVARPQAGSVRKSAPAC